jgi:pimeloyl-ACP methyl ester carboxylesterase
MSAHIIKNQTYDSSLYWRFHLINTQTPSIDPSIFHKDINYLESLWQRRPVGNYDLPILDIGKGIPLVFVPILEHLEFVYTKQIQALSHTHRVVLYRRNESRIHVITLAARAEELRSVLDSLGLEQVDLVGHGDAAMVLFEFAIRYPERCHSLIIITQGADYQVAPHPWIWFLHELFSRLPIEHLLPASFLRRTVINYIVGNKQPSEIPAAKQAFSNEPIRRLPRSLIEEQFRKIALWPAVYKYSVLPVIHHYDIRRRLDKLTMPVFLINRVDDVLAPEAKTRWLANHLPNCAGYELVPGADRFFMYSSPEPITELIEDFLERTETRMKSITSK